MLTNAQIQTINARDLLITRMHSVSRLPINNPYRICIEREANEAYHNGVTVADMEYVDEEAHTVILSDYVDVGDYVRVQDDFFRVANRFDSRGGVVLALDDMTEENEPLCVTLANSEV